MTSARRSVLCSALVVCSALDWAPSARRAARLAPTCALSDYPSKGAAAFLRDMPPGPATFAVYGADGAARYVGVAAIDVVSAVRALRVALGEDEVAAVRVSGEGASRALQAEWLEELGAPPPVGNAPGAAEDSQWDVVTHNGETDSRAGIAAVKAELDEATRAGDTDRILTLMGTLLALEGQYEEEGQSGKGKPQAIDDGSVESFG